MSGKRWGKTAFRTPCFTVFPLTRRFGANNILFIDWCLWVSNLQLSLACLLIFAISPPRQIPCNPGAGLLAAGSGSILLQCWMELPLYWMDGAAFCCLFLLERNCFQPSFVMTKDFEMCRLLTPILFSSIFSVSGLVSVSISKFNTLSHGCL